MNELWIWSVGMFWLILDFITAAIVDVWADDFEHQLKKETKVEPRQDEQRRSEDRG